MGLLDFLQARKLKDRIAQLERDRDALQEGLRKFGAMEVIEIQNLISAGRAKLESLQHEAEREKRNATELLAHLAAEIALKKKIVVELDDEILVQEFGLYHPRYEFARAVEYKIELEEVRQKQKMLIKENRATVYPTNFTFNNDLKEGARMVRDFQKVMLNAFNSECEANITDVKFNNVHAIEDRIVKSWENKNKLGQRFNVQITREFLNLKLSELRLAHEFAMKKNEEKEEQRKERERLREAAKVAKEIEEARAKVDKEEKHFKRAEISLSKSMERAATETEKEVYQAELMQLREKLTEIAEAKKEIDYREQNTRAGYVYVVSNIGSFGERIIKIGMTRRLDPYERVEELSDASVPFDFDVHAMVFSDDAPKLENALHKAFAMKRLNRVNLRREFFDVTLAEVEEVIKSNFAKPVEFVRTPPAGEYRESILIAAEGAESRTRANPEN